MILFHHLALYFQNCSSITFLWRRLQLFQSTNLKQWCFSSNKKLLNNIKLSATRKFIFYVNYKISRINFKSADVATANKSTQNSNLRRFAFSFNKGLNMSLSILVFSMWRLRLQAKRCAVVAILLQGSKRWSWLLRITNKI